MAEIVIRTSSYEISLADYLVLQSGIYQLANSAVVRYVNKDSESLKKLKEIVKEGDSARLSVDGQVMLTGQIADVWPDYSEHDAPALTIRLKSAAAAVVNRPVGTGKYYMNQKASAILAELFAGISLDIRQDATLKTFVTTGMETVGEAAARLAEVSGLLIYSGADGRLIADVKNPDKRKIGWLATGSNVLGVTKANRPRRGVAIFGQKPLDDDTELDDAVYTSLSSGSEINEIVCVDDVSSATLSSYCRETVNQEVESVNWFNTDGALLELNQWIGTADAWALPFQEMLICSLVFRLDDGAYSSVVGLEGGVNDD